MRKSVWLLSAALFTIAAPAICSDGTAQHRPQPAAADRILADRAGGGRAGRPGRGRHATGRHHHHRAGPPPDPSGRSDRRDRRRRRRNEELRRNRHPPAQPACPVAARLLDGTEANGSARIRGIGTVGDNPGLESSVAVFIDGVYRSRSGIGLNELGEIDRVEVLRGPQGTLFGRNASAGLINIISKRPSFTPEVYGEATFGNYDLRRLSGGVTGADHRHPRRATRRGLCQARRLLQGSGEPHDDQQPQPLLHPRAAAVPARRQADGSADRRLHVAQGALLRRDLRRQQRQFECRQSQRAGQSVAAAGRRSGAHER